MARFSRRLLVAAIGIGVLLPLGGPAAGEASARLEPPTRLATAAGAGAIRTITLITGDKVVVGNGRVIEARPGPGRAGMVFHQSRIGKQQRVIPLDAIPLIANGKIDERLFDVSLLAEHGFDDGSSPELPLLVEYGGDTRTAKESLKGARVVRDVPVVDAVAIEQDRRTTNDLWKRLKGGQAAGIEKVWLDGGVRVSLDRSVEQIGAPRAWRQGATGKGVKVAVLDTGYDPEHPDLADAVVATKDFTESDSTDDSHGHGTHVASTLAGSGAASQGRRKGVAPDAELVIGKVCDPRGGCTMSAILAGMQWAADEGARIVSMSLGGFPTDGTDPMSVAVNELTARTGTLFVVAAGNLGGGGQRINTPASADAALAVGSVTKSDSLSSFSSTGPRWDDLGLKPELTAPGSRIVAARATGTLDPVAVDESYAELSGTSMATPHVAGAAAILAQLHSDWKAPELRSALMGSAHPLDGLGVYEQGAGRVDVARAVGQRITSLPGSVDLGTAAYPHDDDQPITKTVAYRNDSDRSVRLRLTLDIDGPDGKPAPRRMFDLSTRTLDVAPHGTASVRLTADPAVKGPDGAYGGWLVAEGGGASIRTTVGVNKEIPSYDLTVKILDRDGNPARFDEVHWPVVFLMDVSNGVYYQDVLEDGTLKLRLPSGRYELLGLYATANGEGQGYREVVQFPEPDLVIDRDLDLVLDSRKANPVAMRAPVAGASLAAADLGFVRKVIGSDFVVGTLVLNPMRPDAKLDLYHVPGRTGRGIEAFGNAIWAKMPDNPKPDRDFFRDSPYLYRDAVHWPGGFPERPSLITAPSDYAMVDAHYAAAKPGTVGSLYGFPVPPGLEAVGAYIFIPNMEVSLPFRRTEYYSTRGGMRWSFLLNTYRYLNDETPEIEDGAYIHAPVVRYRAGRTHTEHWNRGVFGPNLPSHAVGQPFGTPVPWVSRDGDSLTVGAPMYADGGTGRAGDAYAETERTTLHRDGRLVGSSDAKLVQVFALPPGEATYRLGKEVTYPADQYRLSTKISADWTFRSRRTPDGTASALPLLTVRYAPELDEHNNAPSGRFRLPVRIERQSGKAPIRSLAVEASYDDGTTWHPAPVRRTATGWTAVLDHPANGFVSLRASATDTAGNRVDQTILRAYQIG